MNTNVNMGLEGEFHIKIYSGKTLMEEVGPVKNFITPTGLTFPQIYPFVDCFRFLSLGSNNVPDNQGGYYTGTLPAPTSLGVDYWIDGNGKTGQRGTTGLSTPIPTYMTQQGTQESGQYIGWQGYANGSDGSSSACGTLLTEQGLKFYRAWNIPTGGVNGVNCTMSGTNNGVGLVINEFMVSPSSGSDPTGQYAFSRVRRTVTIKEGYSAIISYQLSINFSNTGLTYFANTFSTGSADVTSDPYNDQQLISDWANLSGYYRHVYHGLNIINQAGAHDTPVDYGAGMEPSLTDLSDYCFYLSPDNSNFDISTTGASGSNEASAYAADGLMGLVYGIQMSPFLGTQILNDDVFYGPTPVPGDGLSVAASIDWPQIPTNIRIGSSEHCSIPSVTNYVTGAETSCGGYQMFNDASQYDISYATPGALRKKTNEVDYKQQAIFSTRVSKLPIDTGNAQNTISGRTKTVTRKTLFSPVSSLGWNTRFGSLVFATNTPSTPGSNIYSPIVDTLFFDTSGRSLMQHYRYVNVVLDNRGTGVADAYISITPTGENINVFASGKTFQGAYDVVDGNISGFNPLHPVLTLGNCIPLSGFSDINNTNGDYSYSFYGCSGYGMVYGIITGANTAAQVSNGNFDCGLVDHNVTGNVGGNGVLSLTLAPTSTGNIYWPNQSNQLKLKIDGIKYYMDNSMCSNFTAGQPISSGDPGYTWASNPCNFCPPTGHIVHYENIGTTGFRLLPNYAAPNNQGNNYYSVTQGGALPGTSFNNGIELYQNIIYSAECSDSVNCVDS
jgi:hypothetical protein